MIRVFSASVPIRAHIVRGALQAAGIQAEVRGEGRTSLAGGLPIDACYAEVWVSEDTAEEAAGVLERLIPSGRAGELSLLGPYALDGGEVSLTDDWLCVCGERNPSTFELCWSCGTSPALDPGA